MRFPKHTEIVTLASLNSRCTTYAASRNQSSTIQREWLRRRLDPFRAFQLATTTNLIRPQWKSSDWWWKACREARE